MTGIRLFALALTALAAAGQTTQATATGSLVGRAVDERGNPQSRATVYVKQIGPDPEHKASVSSDGSFRIGPLPAGDYQVAVINMGGHIREHVRVGDGVTDVGPVMTDDWQCQCAAQRAPSAADPSYGALSISFGDNNANRLLNAWIHLRSLGGAPTVDEWRQQNVRHACACTVPMASIGHAELLGGLRPGPYALTALAAGYAGVDQEVTVVGGTTVGATIRWQPEQRMARPPLETYDDLVQMETGIGSMLIAVDTRSSTATRFLADADRHAFDDARLDFAARTVTIVGSSIGLKAEITDRAGLPFGLRLFPSNSTSARLLAGAGETSQPIGRLLSGLPAPYPTKPVVVLAVSRVR